MLSESLTALESWFAVYGIPIATIIAALFVVGGTPLIAAIVYFKRKEYETVRQRYLDGTLDKIIKQVEHGLSIFEYNWAHSIHLLRTFRDGGANVPSELYTSGFADLNELVSLEAPSHYLLTELIGDKVFWNVHQLLIAFLHEADNLFKYDLCTAIMVSIKGPIQGTTIDPPEKIFEAYETKLAEIHKECRLYYVLLGNLQLLSTQFNKNRYRFNSLNKFRKDPKVIEVIKNLNEVFAEDLGKYATDDESIKETKE